MSDSINEYTAVSVYSAPAYDADGNMLSFNGSTFTYDGENRLKSATKAGITYVYTYDALNRRIGEAYSGLDTALYASSGLTWDGWNIHTETLGPDISMPATVKKYTWGLDLSESLQGAGGIGGLLWERVNNNEASFALYDGNGNVTAYVAGNGVYQQAYKYDAFLNATPTIANGASYRFQASTKSYNARYGLLDYQLRSYCPILGRWIQEDPIQENGGINLYAFVNNNAIGYIDYLGLVPPMDMYKALKKLGKKAEQKGCCKVVQYVKCHIGKLADEYDDVKIIEGKNNELLSIINEALGAIDEGSDLYKKLSLKEARDKLSYFDEPLKILNEYTTLSKNKNFQKIREIHNELSEINNQFDKADRILSVAGKISKGGKFATEFYKLDGMGRMLLIAEMSTDGGIGEFMSFYSQAYNAAVSKLNEISYLNDGLYYNIKTAMEYDCEMMSLMLLSGNYNDGCRKNLE